MLANHTQYANESFEHYAGNLHKNFRVDIFLPLHYHQSEQLFPVLFLNDGQDAQALDLKNTLQRLEENQEIEPFILVGIHTNKARIFEYGIASQADYAHRGNKAKEYTEFLMYELMPFLYRKYRISHQAEQTVIAGFSLGGLSAFDIAWHHPQVFRKVGVFSGSFWWRKKSYDNHYTDNDRIMHDIVRRTFNKPDLKFWLQVATKDEEDDRNDNNIIDAIDDCIDMVNELVWKGYHPFEDICYIEMLDGEHNPQTWAKIMPHFLKWAFPKNLVKKS